jgi:inner membrane protein
MSGPNHVVGGIVFTGIYLSMFDTNILSKPLYLGITAFFAVLADIDHTRTPIGKLFYPIAKWLDRKHGHRTLTHSLLFYVCGIITVGIIEVLLNSKTGVYSQIFIWSYGSHLIFDMLTKQGVPLLYPFKKNPCVMPANPDFRFRSSDLKTEAMLFIGFVLLGLSCKSLFAQGFWNTYNRAFDNIKHVYAETLKTEKVIKLEYEIFKNGNKLTGTANVVEGNNNYLLLLNKNGFLRIEDNQDRIIKLKPTRTELKLRKIETSFTNISTDSLRQLVAGKNIVQLKIQSVLPIYFTKDNQPQLSNNFSLEYAKNPVFRTDRVDSMDLNIAKEIAEINIQLLRDQNESQAFNLKRSKAISDLTETEADLLSTDLSIRQKATEELQQKKTAFLSMQNIPNFSTGRDLLLLRKRFLNTKLHIKKSQLINGYLAHYETF